MKILSLSASTLLCSIGYSDEITSGYGFRVLGGLIAEADSAFTPGGLRIKKLTGSGPETLVLSESGDIYANDGSAQGLIAPTNRKYVDIAGNARCGGAIDEFGHLHVWWDTFNSDPLESYLFVEGNFTGIAEGYESVLAINSGKLELYGRESSVIQTLQCVELPSDNNFVKVKSYRQRSVCNASDANWFAALDVDGRISTFGLDPESYGRLDVPSGYVFKDMALTRRAGFGLTLDGLVVGWGNASAVTQGPFESVWAGSKQSDNWAAITEDGRVQVQSDTPAFDVGFPVVALAESGNNGANDLWIIGDKPVNTITENPGNISNYASSLEAHDELYLNQGEYVFDASMLSPESWKPLKITGSGADQTTVYVDELVYGKNPACTFSNITLVVRSVPCYLSCCEFINCKITTDLSPSSNDRNLFGLSSGAQTGDFIVFRNCTFDLLDSRLRIIDSGGSTVHFEDTVFESKNEIWRGFGTCSILDCDLSGFEFYEVNRGIINPSSVHAAVLNFDGSVFSENFSVNGSVVNVSASEGNPIRGTLIRGGSFYENGSIYGGSIYSEADLGISDSYFARNNAEAGGGGLHQNYRVLSWLDSED